MDDKTKESKMQEYDLVLEAFAADYVVYLRENLYNPFPFVTEEKVIADAVSAIKAGNSHHVRNGLLDAEITAVNPVDSLMRRLDDIEKIYPPIEHEALFLLDGETYLHMKTAIDGYEYILYGKENLQYIDGGLVSSIDHSFDEAYGLALEAEGLTPEISEIVPLDILDDIERNLDSRSDLPQAVAEQKPEKQYDLGYGYMGNGLTVWNRLEEENNDYVTVAHIDPDRSVTFYDKDMADSVKAQIHKEALTSNMYLSKDVPIFRTPAQTEEKEQAVQTNYRPNYIDLLLEHIDNHFDAGYLTAEDREFLQDNIETLNKQIIQIAETYEKGMPLDGETDAIDGLFSKMLQQSKKEKNPSVLAKLQENKMVASDQERKGAGTKKSMEADI